MDSDKSGTVRLSELLRAFAYPPFPQAVSSRSTPFDTTELVLLCLVLASDAPLLDSVPFTTTVQQCMQRAVAFRNTTELTLATGGSDAEPQNMVVSMSAIATLLAEWTRRSLQPWFQTAKQSQPHRHRRMPRSLFFMLKILHDNTQRQLVCEHLAKHFRIYLAQRSVSRASEQATPVPDGSSLFAQISDLAALLYSFVLFRLSSTRSRGLSLYLLVFLRSSHQKSRTLSLAGTYKSTARSTRLQAMHKLLSRGCKDSCKATSPRTRRTLMR